MGALKKIRKLRLKRKQFGQSCFVVAVSTGILLGIALALNMTWLPPFLIILSISLVAGLKGQVYELRREETIYHIVENAAGAAIQLSIAGLAITGAMLIFIGGLINPWLVMVGYTMSYSVIILMVVYCMSYLYYCIDKEITW